MIKEIIDSGEIGKVININNTENVAYWHHAHSYTRGNWKDSKETGPMILTKCSHDLDLLFWLTGKNVKRISSFGNRSYLTKENDLEGSANHCEDCTRKDECAFNAYRFYLNNKEWLRPIIGDDLSDENIYKSLKGSPYSKCVFKCDSDVVDHQIVNIEFEDKTTASHTMNAFTRYCYRDIKIMGSKGCIEGNFEDKKFTVYHFLDNSERVVDITDYTDDFIGHGGGDRVMFKEVIDYLLTGNKTVSLTSIQESVMSHEMAFAAEKSRVNNGEVVEITYKVK
jgi:predicted dehydrogenase